MKVGFEWMWNRNKRVANLLLAPNVLLGAMRLCETVDRWCDANDARREYVTLGDAKFIKGMQYVEYPLLKDGA